MAVILNIETSTEICSVCIAKSKSSNITLSSEKAYEHASRITLLIQEAVAKAEITMQDLDAVAISGGPGSFTGLRVGAATAKGICFALDIPLIAIDTLTALAKAAQKKEPNFDFYFPMIDARRMEVYTARHDHIGRRLEEDKALIIEPHSFSSDFENGKNILFCGNGAPKIFDIISSAHAHLSPVICSADYLVDLSFQAFENEDFVDMAYYSPNYLKAPNITQPKKIL